MSSVRLSNRPMYWSSPTDQDGVNNIMIENDGTVKDGERITTSAKEEQTGM